MVTKTGADERGVAIVVALLAAILLASIGTGLLVVSDTETRIAANYRTSVETFYAADAGVHLALADLRGISQWTQVLTGAAVSTFRDTTRQPVLASRQRLDLDAVTAELQAESNSVAVWGADNPVWRLFAWGPLAAAGSGMIDSMCYLVVWVADDPADADGNPLADSNGRVRLHAEAYASTAIRRVVEVTAAQTPAGVRVLVWREVR